MAGEKDFAKKYSAVLPFLDERQRRLVVAGDAVLLGKGSISRLSQASGLSRPTIYKGISDLQSDAAPEGRVRGRGGGRKRLSEKEPTILKELEALVDPVTRGDPMSPLRWTCKSTRRLAADLQRAGHRVSHTVVAELLAESGYSLQSNVKAIEGTEHPDRDEQFRYISKLVSSYLKRGLPVISVDTKKKELIGPYKNSGKTWRPMGSPERVKVHDFIDPKVGKAIPYGVYDVGRDQGWVNVGCDADTASFAVESIRGWWRSVGRRLYPTASGLLITADSGGSNGYRTRLWKVELQALVEEIGKDITVCHFPPGTSKWNKVEHRLFSHISMNWRGKPLTSHEVVVSLIGATATRSGLRVRARLDQKLYPREVKVSDEEYAKVRIRSHTFHGEWNYTIKKPPSSTKV
jgi:transposase